MLLKALNVIALMAVITIGGFSYLRPAIAQSLWAEDYKSNMFQCDHVMREHYIAKMAVEYTPSELTIRNLQSSELGLLDCHEYDKLRKKLISWGLNDNDLSMIGIEALEEQEYELRDFVRIHEFRYQ
jgi:hypothetical protein